MPTASIPVGACVGPRGSRVRMVVSELRGEKIDIIPHNDEPARFVAKALSPARVREVLVDDEDKQATVIVPDDQLSLAIGRDGQNARLAARLTGWRVDIKSESEFAQEEEEITYEGEEDFDGRCMAMLSNGRRCPNAAVGGTTYCGLPTHQALGRFQTSQVAVLNGLSEEQIATLADPEGDEAAVAAIVGPAEAAFEAMSDEDEGSDASAAGPVAEEDPRPRRLRARSPPRATRGRGVRGRRAAADTVAKRKPAELRSEAPPRTRPAEEAQEPEADAEAPEPQPERDPDAPGSEAEDASGSDSDPDAPDAKQERGVKWWRLRSSRGQEAGP